MKFNVLKYFLPKKPLNRTFGWSIGTPIDRYYIENFLAKNKSKIAGDILEIAENTYSLKFGMPNSSIKVLGYENSKGVDLVCDLSSDNFELKNIADAFILTQTLPFTFDIKKMLSNCYSLLRPGGSLFITVPGITQISRYDYDRWGQFWSFTEKSLEKLIQESCQNSESKVESFGNVKVASCFLYGIPRESLSKSELDYVDNDYQFLITAVVKKND